MRNRLAASTERHRRDGLGELVAELEAFSHDGLTLLRDHLRAGRVVRGSWSGCVLSYRRGAPGSTRRDRQGRARNALTILWDGGCLTDEEVLAAVNGELARRGSTAAHPPAREPASPLTAAVHRTGSGDSVTWLGPGAP